MAAAVALGQPVIFVAELEDLFASSIGERDSLAAIVEVAAVLTGDVESIGFVDGGEGREVFNYDQEFSGRESLDGRGCEVEFGRASCRDRV